MVRIVGAILVVAMALGCAGFALYTRAHARQAPPHTIGPVACSAAVPAGDTEVVANGTVWLMTGAATYACEGAVWYDPTTGQSLG